MRYSHNADKVATCSFVQIVHDFLLLGGRRIHYGSGSMHLRGPSQRCGGLRFIHHYMGTKLANPLAGGNEMTNC